MKRTSIATVLSALCVLCMTIMLAACGNGHDIEQYEAVGPRIKIGVPLDQPALSVRAGTTYAGFNIDVATYIADQLGYAPWQIEWVDAAPNAMGRMLTEGSIDLAVGLYVAQSQLDEIEQHTGLLLAGSYAQDTSSVMVIDQVAAPTVIAKPSDIAGKPVCTVSAEDLSHMQWPHSTQVLQQPSVMQCATALMTGSVDAVIAPHLALAGIERSGLQNNSAATGQTAIAQVHVLQDHIDTGAYYVAVKPQAQALKERIVLAIHSLHASSAWKDSVQCLTQQTGLHIENTH